MLSKILISQSQDRKPAIKITEKYSDDVRDLLTVNLRQDLKSTSATFTIEFIEQSENGIEYLITPVSDEISYFKERMYELIGVSNRSVQTIEGHTEPLVDSDIALIDEFFEKIKKYIK